MAAIGMSVATGVFFSTYSVCALLLGLALPMSRLKTSMLRATRVFGMRCSVTSQYRSRQAIASLSNMKTQMIQLRSALKTRSITLTDLRKIRSRAKRTLAPSFQAGSTCHLLTKLRETTAYLLQITLTGQSFTLARNTLVGFVLLRRHGF